MAKDNSTRDERLKNLEQITKDLENKSCELEDKLFQRDTDLEQFKMNIQMNMRGLNGVSERLNELEDHDEDHDKRIKELEQGLKEANDKLLLAGQGGGDGVDGDALASLLESLRKECDDKYAPKDSFEDLVKRVEQLENDFGDIKETVGESKSESGLTEHSKEIKDLKNWKEAQESEMAGLKQLLASGAGEGVEIPQQFSADEVQKLKEVIHSFPETVKDVEKLKEAIGDFNL